MKARENKTKRFGL